MCGSSPTNTRAGGICDEAGASSDAEASAGGTATLPRLRRATRAIEDIAVGDRVWARDEHDPAGPLVLRRVTAVHRRLSDHLRILRLVDEDGREQEVRTTDEHPFHAADEGWTAAGKLRIGQWVSGPDGSSSRVLASGRQEHPEGIEVFNLTVEQSHTYFVAGEGADAAAVWVHNTCEMGGSIRGRFQADAETSFGPGARFVPISSAVSAAPAAGVGATRVALEISSEGLSSLDQLRIRLKYNQANRLLASGEQSALTGANIKYRSYYSQKYVRNLMYPQTRGRGTTVPKGWQVDEYISRQFGGRQVWSNQHLLPDYLNTKLGPIEYNAVAGFPNGTRITGFDVKFKTGG